MRIKVKHNEMMAFLGGWKELGERWGWLLVNRVFREVFFEKYFYCYHRIFTITWDTTLSYSELSLKRGGGSVDMTMYQLS
jgi:hypothetical protein